jgi:RNA polymerase sigma-70 factor (ECF subfamily)
VERLGDVVRGRPAVSASLADARARRATSSGARGGEVARVEDLIRREGEALLAYFARRVQPREDAADLLGETFAVVWRRARDLPESAEASRMWIYGVARKVLATHRRGQGRRTALTDQLRADLILSAPDGHHGASAHAEHAADLVRQLPTPDREIFMLLHWDGFTLTEIGQLLGMPAGTVRSRYARARAALKKNLESAEG